MPQNLHILCLFFSFFLSFSHLWSVYFSAHTEILPCHGCKLCKVIISSWVFRRQQELHKLSNEGWLVTNASQRVQKSRDKSIHSRKRLYRRIKQLLMPLLFRAIHIWSFFGKELHLLPSINKVQIINTWLKLKRAGIAHHWRAIPTKAG